MPLVECLHACPFEQAQCPSLQPPHQSLWDSNQDKRKTTDLAVLKTWSVKSPDIVARRSITGLCLLLNQNNKNPFVLVEAMPLVECLHACPFEQAQCPSLQPPPIPLGFQPGQKKNPGSSNLKKQAAPICEIREICER